MFAFAVLSPDAVVVRAVRAIRIGEARARRVGDNRRPRSRASRTALNVVAAVVPSDRVPADRDVISVDADARRRGRRRRGFVWRLDAPRGRRPRHGRSRGVLRARARPHLKIVGHSVHQTAERLRRAGSRPGAVARLRRPLVAALVERRAAHGWPRHNDLSVARNSRQHGSAQAGAGARDGFDRQTGAADDAFAIDRVHRHFGPGDGPPRIADRDRPRDGRPPRIRDVDAHRPAAPRTVVITDPQNPPERGCAVDAGPAPVQPQRPAYRQRHVLGRRQGVGAVVRHDPVVLPRHVDLRAYSRRPGNRPPPPVAERLLRGQRQAVGVRRRWLVEGERGLRRVHARSRLRQRRRHGGGKDVFDAIAVFASAASDAEVSHATGVAPLAPPRSLSCGPRRRRHRVTVRQAGHLSREPMPVRVFFGHGESVGEAILRIVIRGRIVDPTSRRRRGLVGRFRRDKHVLEADAVLAVSSFDRLVGRDAHLPRGCRQPGSVHVAHSDSQVFRAGHVRSAKPGA